MPRTVLSLLVVTGFAAFAAAQPGVLLMQGSQRGGPAFPAGIGPVTTRPDQPGIIYFTAIAPWGWATGWGYRTYNPWTGYGYTFGGYLPEGRVQPLAPAAPNPPQREPTVALANEFPATLTVQFPAPATVWLNGATVTGEPAEERVLTSPVLKPGEEYTFEVKARWTNRGKTYESVRTVTLGAGDRSRLLVVSGTEVR